MSVQKAQPSSKPSNLMYCLSNFRQKPGLKLSIKIILPIIAHTKKSQKVQVTSHNCTSVCLKRKEKNGALSKEEKKEMKKLSQKK